MKKLAVFAILAAPLLMAAGCNAWERTTFNTLAASQATINAAQAAYEVSATAPCPPQGTVACLPHSTADYNIINEAKAAQTLAVNAMVTYEEAKASASGSTGLDAAEAAVNSALANLGTLIGDVKNLYTTPGGAQ
jgi:hypothetical protein